MQIHFLSDVFVAIAIIVAKAPYYQPHEGSLKTPRGRRVLKAKILKGKCRPELKFPRRGSSNPEKTLGGERCMDVFILKSTFATR